MEEQCEKKKYVKIFVSEWRVMEMIQKELPPSK